MHARFFIEPKIGDAREIRLADKEIYHQIIRVLRRKKGDAVNLLDNSGYQYHCVILDISDDFIALKILDKKPNAAEPLSQVVLYQSLLKKDKMEWVLEKCTEIGVTRFVPMLSEHSVKLSVNMERATKILKESAEQCGRGKIPELSGVLSYKDAVAEAKKSGFINALLHNQEMQEDSAAAVFNGKNVNLFIGPEGGFSEAEVNSAKENGFQIISISPRTLRAETAAVAGSFLCFISSCR